MPEYKHAMVDIETLDTAPTGVILTIGVVLFDPFKDPSEDTRYHIVVPDVLNEERTISLDTVKWWAKQGEYARGRVLLSKANSVGEVRDVIEKLLDAEHIWANDPDFDCVMLADFSKGWGRWPFWKGRSLRTLKALYDTSAIFNEDIVHDALDDAKTQVRIVRAVLNNELAKTTVWNSHELRSK